jgi:hypothetical protein
MAGWIFGPSYWLWFGEIPVRRRSEQAGVVEDDERADEGDGSEGVFHGSFAVRFCGKELPKRGKFFPKWSGETGLNRLLGEWSRRVINPNRATVAASSAPRNFTTAA